MKGLTLRKAGAVALAGAMTLSCASCMLFGPNKKEIVEAADNFAGTLLKCDAGKVVKLTNEKKNSDAAAALELLFDESMYTEEQNKFIDAVADTITYEVDEESVEVDKEEASVDVTFTMVDYEKALKDDYSDIDEVLDLLEDCEDTKEVEVTFEFEKDDDEWLLSNLKDKKFGKIFDFYTYELSLKPDLASCISDTYIYGGSYYVDMDVYFSEDISEYDGELTFDVYFDGTLISSGNVATVYSSDVYCEYYDANYDYLESGSYTIDLMYGDTLIASETTDVDNDWVTETAAPFTGDYSSELSSTDWWLDNGDDTYDVGVTEIELDFYFNVDVYSEDFTFDVFDADGNTIESYIQPQMNSYSVYCIWDPGYEIPAGGYYIQLFDGDTSDAAFIGSGYCEVK